MSLYIAPRPSQGATTLKFSTVFLEDEDLDDLQDDVNTLLAGNESTFSPSGERFLSDIQYQAEGDEDDERMHSVMIVFGEWNPV